jgi:hypothetical protein
MPNARPRDNAGRIRLEEYDMENKIWRIRP